MEKFNIPKLKGKCNWTVWKLQILSSLQYHDYEGVLSGEIKQPDPLPADANNEQKKVFEANVLKYKKANGFAVTLLTTSVEDEALQLILCVGWQRRCGISCVCRMSKNQNSV